MPEAIRALTVLEPWASLIRLCAKEFETRSWPTHYRGDLVIHAGKSPAYLYMTGHPELPVFRKYFTPQSRWDVTLGAALCVVTLIACHRVEDIRAHLSEQKRQFGDYSAGRYAWELKNVRPFAQPIPARGAQGLWVWNGPLPEMEV